MVVRTCSGVSTINKGYKYKHHGYISLSAYSMYMRIGDQGLLFNLTFMPVVISFCCCWMRRARCAVVDASSFINCIPACLPAQTLIAKLTKLGPLRALGA